jgi:hypothetical protein
MLFCNIYDIHLQNKITHNVLSNFHHIISRAHRLGVEIRIKNHQKPLKTTQMETTKIILYLTNEQKQSLLQQLTGSLFPEQPKPDRYKYFRENTKQFIIELEKKYGNNWINRKDNFVKELMYKHRIGDLAQILKNIDSDIQYVGDGKKTRIVQFKINH